MKRRIGKMRQFTVFSFTAIIVFGCHQFVQTGPGFLEIDSSKGAER